MRSWNVIVTVATGPGRQSRLLGQLRHFGYFDRTGFKNVCIGHVENTPQFLETLEAAHRNGKAWFSDLGRVIPVEQPFPSLPKPWPNSLNKK
jgi:hypothetical protein